jgi:hypothetical protein
MSNRSLARRALSAAAAALLALLVIPATAAAQVTTGGLSGTVVDADGNNLPGVLITATHQPTNTKYVQTTDEKGRFLVVNAKVGGPYVVRAELDGFQTVETETAVRLGDTVNVEIALGRVVEGGTVEVTGEAGPIDPNRTGATSALSSKEIETVATVRRNIVIDGARIASPYASIRANDENQKDISFAGRSSKYNNIQIDGSNYNDLFGLGESGGTPGGQTNSQPVQQDVVAELQVGVSPYDVRQGGFTGGAINAITRSGTNDFHGSAYYAERDPDYVGDGPFDVPIRDFDEEQIGASLGGYFSRDKVWFFVAGETNEKLEASGFSADGSTGQQYRDPAGAARLQDILLTQYGYDAGGLGDVPIATESDHLFGRLDWNISDGHQLTGRYSYVEAFRDDVANRSTSVFRFPKATFSRDAEIESFVTQYNGIIGRNMFVEARLGQQSMDDVRNVPEAFPSVEVGLGGPRRGDLIAGTEQFSGVNTLLQDVLEVHGDLSFLRGDHSFIVGTHNEFFDITNFFLASAYGYYWFPTLDDLEAGVASEYQISFKEGGDPFGPVSDFGISQYGLYASDQWRAKENLTFTFGLRADNAAFDDDPPFNPAVLATFGVNTSNVPDDNLILSPRVGFNWDPGSDANSQLRGGLGLFAGRAPYVWISNAYAGSGIGSQALTTRGAIPFNPDPLGQPHSGGGAVPTVDLIDPDFEFPQVWRATLAYDRTLPWWGLNGTVEAVHSRTEQDIYYTNINKVQTGTSALDGRPTYSTFSSSFANAILLTNTDEGEDTLLSLVLSRPARGGLGFNAGYTWMDSENAFDGTSSRAISNWQFHPTKGDITRPEKATSSWENENRWYVNLFYDLATGPVTHSFGLFWNAESGRPYSILMGAAAGTPDANRDGFATNDLLYVPASPDEVILSGFTWDQFLSYLSTNGVDCRGCIVDRNGQQGPWVRRLDFHYGLEVPIKMVRAQITLDIINLLNVFDEDEGVVRSVAFGTTTPIRTSVDAATGKVVYSQNFSNAITDTDSPFSTVDVLSRWQARLGLRVSF